MSDGVIYIVQVHGDWNGRYGSWRPAFGTVEASGFNEVVAKAKTQELEAKARALGLIETRFQIVAV